LDSPATHYNRFMQTYKLTNANFKTASLICGGVGLLLFVSLVIGYPAADYAHAARALILTTGILWGALAVALSAWGWNVYYQYLYPAWARPLAPLFGLLYAAIAVGMWTLSNHLGGNPVVWFVLLGGLEGVLEHLIGIYGLRILQKVPWLKGVSPLPVLVFSFFEYVTYWCLALWAVFLVQRLFL